MFSCRNHAIVVVGLFVLTPRSGVAQQDQWPTWRGPLASGVSMTADPPAKWSETENIKWKVKIPSSGNSSPIVWKDRIYLLTAVPVHKSATAGNEVEVRTASLPQQQGQRGQRPGGFGSAAPSGAYKFLLLCLDRKTGKTLFERVARETVPHEGHHQDHGFASYSPVTDGKHVFAFFGSRGLHCYDMDGNLKWSKDLGKMQTRNGFGEGSTPALYGDTIVVTWDHEGSDFIVAFDKNSGDEKWRKERDEPTTWSTPLIVQHGDSVQVVTAGSNRVRSYDLKTGKLIWQCSGLTSNVIPSPVYSNGTVYVTSGYRGSALLAIKLGKEGDLTGTDAITWTHNRATPYVPSPLLYEDRIYFFGSNNPILSCFDIKTGQPVIDSQRIEGMQGVYSSPVGASGRVYLVGRNGVSVVLKRSDKLEVLATNTLDDRIDASPALVGKELFLRGREYLYCISEK